MTTMHLQTARSEKGRRYRMGRIQRRTRRALTKLHVAIELTPGDGPKFRKYDTWQDQGQGGDAGFTRLHTRSTEALLPGQLRLMM